MREIFMRLLWNLTDFGNVKSANFYQGETLSTFTIETPDGVFDISIMKKNEVKENGN